MRSRGVDPTGRTIQVDRGTEIAGWLTEVGGTPRDEPVRLTISVPEDAHS